MFYVYKITNLINDKSYIGATSRTPEERFKEHSYRAYSAIGSAIQKYGVQNFQLEVLENCESLEEMFQREQYYIEYYDSYQKGYNCTLGGEGGKRISVDDSKIIQTYLTTKSSQKAAQKLNISENSVLRALHRNNIELFGSGVEASLRVDSDTVIKEYRQTRSILQVAKNLRVDPGTVYRRLQSAGIETQAYRLNLEEEQEIVEDYLANKTSMTQLEERYNVNRKTISRILKAHKIPIEGRTGKTVYMEKSDGETLVFASQAECAKYLIKEKLVPQASPKYVAEKIGQSIRKNQLYNNIYFYSS